MSIPDRTTRTPAVQTANASVASEMARAESETHALIVSAKRFPRDPRVAMAKIADACARIGLAEVATYEYPRGKEIVSGPSVRLAESIAQLWGNMLFGIKELSQQDGESTVESFAWDLEGNTKQVRVFQVPHIRHTRSGSYKLTDPRDIYETVANQGARRLRACILGVIPGDVIELALHQCEITVIASKPTAERINTMLAKFSAIGVSKASVEKYLRHGTDPVEMKTTEILKLGKIYTAILEGSVDKLEYFPEATSADTGATDKTTNVAQQDAQPQPQPQPQPRQLRECSDEEFSANLASWMKSINSKRFTPAQIIAMASTKFRLTPAQQSILRSSPVTGDIPPQSKETPVDEWVEEFDRANKDSNRG